MKVNMVCILILYNICSLDNEINIFLLTVGGWSKARDKPKILREVLDICPSKCNPPEICWDPESWRVWVQPAVFVLLGQDRAVFLLYQHFWRLGTERRKSKWSFNDVLTVQPNGWWRAMGDVSQCGWKVWIGTKSCLARLSECWEIKAYEYYFEHQGIVYCSIYIHL